MHRCDNPAFFAAAIMLVGSLGANAAALAPGGGAKIQKTTLPAGSTIFASVTGDLFTSSHGVIGNVLEQVLMEPGGTLDFTYFPTITTDNLIIIGAVITNFTGYTTDVYMNGPGNYQTSTNAIFRTAGGDRITFSIALNSTTTSPTFIVRTNATSFAMGGSYNLDIGTTFTPVPEPATAANVIPVFGLAMLALRRLSGSRERSGLS